MQHPHGAENALSSGGEEAQRPAGEETRNSKRLKTKHTNKKNTTSGGNNDNNEIEHTKNPKDKNTRSRSDSAPEHLENSKEKNVHGGGTSGNEDSDGSKKKHEALEKIEKEFTDLKDKFFKDKIEQLKKEVDAIKKGTHPQFCEQCKELDDQKSEKIAAAEQWRQYQLQNINNMFEAERQQAEEDCKTEKRLLQERLINTILEKKKKITEDKMTMNITDTTERTNTRQLRRRGGAPPPPPPTQQKKKLTRIHSSPLYSLSMSFPPFYVTLFLISRAFPKAPSINYTLKDSEIQEDLNAIFNKRETRR